MRGRLRPSAAAGSVPAAAAFLVVLGAVLSVTAPVTPAMASPPPGTSRSAPLAALADLAGPAGPAEPTVRTAARPAPQRWLRIERTRRGYLVTAGLQDSRLRITRVDRGLRLVDPGTAELRERLRSCREIDVRVGIGAVCSVPSRHTRREPMKLRVVPRLGHDLVDTSALSARFDVSVLADAGRDVVRLGAGNDFVNGYRGGDRVWGGAGRDWIRTGVGDDVIRGGPGRDRLLGVEGRDVVRGGGGRDEVNGGPGRDRLAGGPGADLVRCGPGRDRARADRRDTRRDCERRLRNGDSSRRPARRPGAPTYRAGQGSRRAPTTATWSVRRCPGCVGS